jgi:hypothetical protein
MPVDGEYGGSDRFLEESGDPPVVIGVERAYSNRSVQFYQLSFFRRKAQVKTRT